MDVETEVIETSHFGEKLAGRYLTFMLSGEEYCVEIQKVQQIIQFEPITMVPKTPEYIKGVINLRGKVIPVVDLRIKFNMDIHQESEKNCIIVLQVGSTAVPLTLGVIIDEVKEVTQIHAENIDEVPSFGHGIDVAFLMGIAKNNENVRMLLDIDRLFSSEEIKKIGEL